MRCVFVLMYKEADQLKPYAVFEDSLTAERMKREGDEIIKVPFFIMDQLVITDDDLKGKQSTTPWTVTWRDSWGKESSTLAPFPPPSYPKVTCNKTVDEHTWRDRVD